MYRLFEPHVEPDGIKKCGSLPDVGIQSSEVYTVRITFGSFPFFLEAALYPILDLHAS